MIVTNDVVTVVGTAVVTIGGLIPVFRSHAKSIGQAILSNAKPISTVVDDAVKVAEDVVKLPELAGLKLKLETAESKLRGSEIASIAGAALHAYERGFDALSQNEKGTLLTLAKTEVAKVFPDVTDQEIITALKTAQNLANTFKGTEAYKATVALEQSLKALTQVQSAPAQSA